MVRNPSAIEDRHGLPWSEACVKPLALALAGDSVSLSIKGGSMAQNPARGLLDDVEPTLGVVESPATVLGDGDDVLDPNAELVGEVDAGLDGEAHPRDQRLFLSLDHVGRFVGRGADAVARAVDELLSV